MFLGIPIYYEEAVRLLKIPNQNGDNSYDIESYLKEKGSKLVFHWVDKYVHIFGLHLEEFWLNENKRLGVDDAIIRILQAKKEFYEEIKKLDIDLHNITIAHMEDQDEYVELAEPFLISLD